MIGIEMTGRAGSELVDRAAADECLAALERHGVVVYRDANISDPDLVEFSRMLGEVVLNPKNTSGGRPEITVITLDRSKSRLATYLQGTFFWHFDGATDELPQKASLLAAHEVADAGGDTEFASTYAAYDALSDSEKAEFADLRVVHSLAASQLLFNPDPTPEERAAWDTIPPREHPLVWTRPNGRKSLVIGASTSEVVGYSPEEGRALLDRLLEWSTQPQFVYRHHWRRGDLVVWDNTGMLHRALPYDPTSARLMHRTTLVGDVAIA